MKPYRVSHNHGFPPNGGSHLFRNPWAKPDALQKSDFSFDLPPPRGGLRSLSEAADCLATKSRALSGLLS
jgi:hypothetical protein